MLRRRIRLQWHKLSNSSDEEPENNAYSFPHDNSTLLSIDPHPTSDSESDDNAPLEIEEEDNVPHSTSSDTLLKWLQLCDDLLPVSHCVVSATATINPRPAIHVSARPHRRVQYHTTKIGKKPSKRTQQERNKEERERTEREARENKALGLRNGNLFRAFGKAQARVDARRRDSEKTIIIDNSDSDLSSNGDVEMVDVNGDNIEEAAACAETTVTPPAPEIPPLGPTTARAFGDDPAAETLLSAPNIPPPPTNNPPPISGFTLLNCVDARRIPARIPSNKAVDAGIKSLHDKLCPPQKNGQRRTRAKLDLVLQARLEAMLRFLRLYRVVGFRGWTIQSEVIAMASGKMGKKTWFARKLRECRFSSSLLSDEDVAGAIHLHLQSLGKWVSAKQIARYVRTPEFQARLRIKRNISVRTTQRWLKKMGYQWKKEPKGMYSDGHEWADVVDYRQNVFLPQWQFYEARSQHWKADTIFKEADEDYESIFYANDRRTTRWVHESETAKIKAKGEGVSDMIRDFVSPEYGWLRSKQLNARGELEDARVLLKPGKKCKGYQTTETILAQVTRAMDILDHDYTADRHIFAYDNATIHTARWPDALSAGPSVNFNKTNGVCVHMRDATFCNGTPRNLYQADGTTFKGLKVLIRERRAKSHSLPDPNSINPTTKKKYVV
ncbi:hypothetical protein MIND_01223500 [Mycena indigotica]|uniref:Transposase n=1 Tax=Mycena indigotica TaxID=2126181 RepID=A0A8H6VVT9_9AGAR|nr:uncharacterized protein MIND_01223500 [Mycena indigotica]KAF7291978.1 hypothetical protein MIND_01223500 [Mycena indigotica]